MYITFDCVYASGRDLRPYALGVRREVLETMKSSKSARRLTRVYETSSSVSTTDQVSLGDREEHAEGYGADAGQHGHLPGESHAGPLVRVAHRWK